MKRILCPKCQNYITFDETQYHNGQKLVFVCPTCSKQFSIRIGITHLLAKRGEEDFSKEEEAELGSILVIENTFGFKQEFSLKADENIIGRKSGDSMVDIQIESADPSMDRRHCAIHVKRNKKGKWIYTLQDLQSITGTFVMNDVLQDKELRILHNGDIITIGATTFIANIPA